LAATEGGDAMIFWRILIMGAIVAGIVLIGRWLRADAERPNPPFPWLR